MSGTQQEEFDEAVAEAIDEQKAMPEAPLSIHIDTYYKGFHSGITIRLPDNKVIPSSRITTMIDNLIFQGFKPSWNEDTNKAQTPAKVMEATAGLCPKCGSPLVEAKKKDGTSYIKCSTNKWNKITKQATGCDYVDWGE
jgi:hypothetical protein